MVDTPTETQQDDFTAHELIRTARTMDAAGVCPDAGEDAVRAVALVLRHLAPAETQQDDEIELVAAALAEAADDGCFHRSMFTEEEWADGAGEDDREWHRKLARAALAARPSSDTETLREREFERRRQVAEHAWNQGWEAAERGGQVLNPYRKPK